MRALEQRIQNSLRNRILWWAFAAILLLGLFIRYSFLPLTVADMKYMNMEWYKAMRDGGIASVLDPKYQWTYSPMHLYLWTLAGLLFPHADALYVLKGVSLLMEAGVLFSCGLLAWAVLPEQKRPFGLFAVLGLLWLNPILVLNVAGWGQTDASYVALSVLSLWLLLKDRPAWSMVSFGLALAFKMQAIFLLPVLLIAYFCREKRFSALWFLLIPAVWIVSGFPMALIGESPFYAFTVYWGQTGMYSKATFNCPNAFALLGDALGSNQMTQGMWQRYGLVAAIALLGGMAVWMIDRRKKLDNRTLLLFGIWCVSVCVFFLPRMHERYGLAGEVLMVLWAVLLWKPRGFLYLLLGALPTISAYCEYMFHHPAFSLQLGAVLNLSVLCLLTWELVRAVASCETLPPEPAAVRQA